ncbi:hypothetical protein [Halobacillus amylolyticus]|uniref:Uncharacterized protein n=1 Tax=Halobacillus amylolyticus TaxID=2932259 RepID=A0ABY4H6H8_9BACI|nr:hypothetical protein [Halobacillus amylolyticus]UOR10292.1 hypothetical protein MUO15_11235 [Halobacillus amylolyticus]
MTVINYMDKETIDEIINNLAFSRVERFYPTLISKSTDIPLNVVFDYLLTLTEDGRLELLWEIRCPDYDCNHIMYRTKDVESYMGKHLECEDCEEEVLVRGDRVFPVFKLNSNYKEHIRNKKKGRNLLKAL